ncbi:hypothetical protein [Roseovarius sp.]|uniref:hypothetical protein n=1 Tax=Roseovarius sp. TaxID=1486281 RepID=UPI003D0DD840
MVPGHNARLMQPICFALCVGIGVGLPSLSQAEDNKQALIATLIESGTHDFEDERHTVEVLDCTMTTYRWRNRPEHGWVLWSSFKFPMALGQIMETKGADGTPQPFASTNFGGERPPYNMVVISFEMPSDTPARFEKSTLRKRPEESWPSPRGDGTTHFYQKAENVNIVHHGPGVVDKARQFTSAFREYIENHCIFTG